MRLSYLLQVIHEEEFRNSLLDYYEDSDQVIKRIEDLANQALEQIGDTQASIYTSGGRVEIGGNHTDHQGGHVLAGSISLDILAVVIPFYDTKVEWTDENGTISIDIGNLNIDPNEYQTTQSLIRGVYAGFHKLGCPLKGLRIFSNTTLPMGSGMSSSAAFEMLIGTILNDVFNDSKLDIISIAKIAQFAENQYFHKPSGLMDQISCAYGGIVGIDFYDLDNIKVQQIPYDFGEKGYEIILTNCGADHSSFTDAYAAITKEMASVAEFFGEKILSKCDFEDFLFQLDEVRSICGDRAILRSYHYFVENQRVLKQLDALEKDDIDLFLQYVKDSGHSSYEYLQNVLLPEENWDQSLAIGLALSEQVLQGRGACRVHGGGFAGTILAIVPEDLIEEYKYQMEQLFYKDCCYELRLRKKGCTRIII